MADIKKTSVPPPTVEQVVDNPPPYSEATSAPSTQPQPESPAAEAEQSKAPTGAQRARAPLRVQQTNSKLVGQFLVFSDDASTPLDGPHAFLQTTNGKIESAIWVNNNKWDRPVRVETRSTNGRIAVAVHTLAKDQAVDIFSQTTNSSNHILLPEHFHGEIVLSTTNSSTELSPSLQPHSVRIPGEKKEVRYEIRGPGGPSRAEIRSTNGKVGAGQVGDESTSAGKDGGSCTVM